MKNIGLIKWFDSEKGFGVILDAGKKEFFLHQNNFEDDPSQLVTGSAIIFESRLSKIKNREEAFECSYITNSDDLKVIFDNLGKDNIIQIEIKTYRNFRTYTNFKPFSILQVALKDFFRKNSDDEVILGLKNYFDKYLDSAFFIDFYEHLEKCLKEHEEPARALIILNNLQDYFGAHLDEIILFEVWFSKKFEYIGYTSQEDYEIPQDLFVKNSERLKINELKRIYDYSFGPNLCKILVLERFQVLDNKDIIEFEDYREYLSYLDVEDKLFFERKIYSLYKDHIFNEFQAKLQGFTVLDSHHDFSEYDILFKNIPKNLTLEDSNKIQDLIKLYIVKNCSSNYRFEIWLKGIIDEFDEDQIRSIFIDHNTSLERKYTILSKLEIEEKFNLLKNSLLTIGIEETYSILEGFLRKENELGYYFKLINQLFDEDFWKDKIGAEILFRLNSFIEKSSDENEKFNLFLRGFIKSPSENIVYQRINELNQIYFQKIINYYINDVNKIKEFLLIKVVSLDYQDLLWLYDIALKDLPDSDFIDFDKQVSQIIQSDLYINLWESKKGRVILFDKIEEKLNDSYDNYLKLDKWLNLGIISNNDVISMLSTYLKRQEENFDKSVFYKHFYHIKYLVSKGQKKIIEEINNDFYCTILWILNESDNFYYQFIKDKFIYFSPEDQVLIIKKLFYSKAIGLFDLTVELLDELTRFDVDLFKLNNVHHPDIYIDLSTDLVIKTLKSLKINNRLPNERELIYNVFNGLNNKKYKVNIGEYFKPCLGRMTANFNWETEGTVKRVDFGASKFYFAIDFPTGETETSYGFYGPRDFFVKNPNFDYLLSQVKKLPGAKWNANQKHWGVASIYEKEVLDFARRERFFIDLDGSNYQNNTHLAIFSREFYDKSTKSTNRNIPGGIKFCEGRLALNKDKLFNKSFYWCKGEICYERCNSNHKTEDYINYTLSDFCKILNLDMNSEDSAGKIVTDGKYYEITSYINRFNRLLEILYCNECEEILHPLETSNFAAHTVVRFCCINDNCNKKGHEVYLNHCLNGKCYNIIDSRVSKKCQNSLQICDKCGSCCSHDMMNRRFENLKTNGGYIHNNLRYAVSEKLGHLEKAEYYCYKCGEYMLEFPNEVFKCLECNVEYQTGQYKIKRPHRHLRKQS